MATTTNYSWTTPNDSDPFKQGASAIRTLGSAVDTTLYTALGGNYPGLRRVKSQTIGTAVGSVQVTDAFNATYDEYKIIISGGLASAGSVHLLLTIGNINANYYSSGVYQVATSSTQVVYNASNAAVSYPGYCGNQNMRHEIDIANPFLTKSKLMNTRFSNYDNVNSTGGTVYIVNTNATSQTYFTISPASGTLTGGRIDVYGYGKS